MTCPNCKNDIPENSTICKFCSFDIVAFNKIYKELYCKKMKTLNDENVPKQNTNSTIVHKPRCPYCNSEDLHRITSMDKVINIAMFGLLGNKRKYQWHCNNCKTNW